MLVKDGHTLSEDEKDAFQPFGLFIFKSIKEVNKEIYSAVLFTSSCINDFITKGHFRKILIDFALIAKQRLSFICHL